MFGISIRITISAIGLKICVIAAGIKKYKSIIKENKKKHHKIVLLAKSKLGADEIVHVPVDLSKLSDVVKNDVVKKTKYDELVKKVNNINTTDTSNLV